MRAADYLDVKTMLERVRQSPHRAVKAGWTYDRGFDEAINLALAALEELFRAPADDAQVHPGGGHDEQRASARGAD